MFDNLFSKCEELGNVKGRIYFSGLHFRHRKVWYPGTSLSRRAIVSLNRIRCGHSSLRESLFYFKIVDSPLCETCNTPESVDHIFWACSRFTTQRIKFMRAIINCCKIFPWPVISLLALRNVEVTCSIATFIDEMHIFI